MLITIVILCLIATAFLPIYFNTLFVAETGRLKVIDPWVAVVLILGLLYKKSWARTLIIVFNALGGVGLFATIYMAGWKDNKVIGLTFLLLLQIVSIFILIVPEVKTFLEEGIKRPALLNR